MINLTPAQIRIGDIDRDYNGRKPQKKLYEDFMRDGCFIMPVVVKPVGNRYLLLDGCSRIVSIVGHIPDDTSVAALVTESSITNAEIIELHNMLNRQRSNNVHNDFLDVQALLNLGVPEHEMHKSVAINVQRIRKLIDISKLPPELIDAWLDDKITTQVIEELAGCDTAVTLTALSEFQKNGKLTAKDGERIKRGAVNLSFFNAMNSTVSDDQRIAPYITALDRTIPKNHRCRIVFEDLKRIFES